MGEQVSTKSKAPKVSASKVKANVALLTQAVPIDGACTGDRWTPEDESHLARLIAIIAMGQAAYTIHILRELLPASPAFTDDDLQQEAIRHLTVQEDGKTPQTGYPRWHRDGFMFEAISWIAARQVYGDRALLKDPHVSATSQGLDGLMIELKEDKSTIVSTTVFEDKCTDHPRKTFLEKVIPALLERHLNKRSPELVASASILLRMAGVDEAVAAKLSAAVMDRSQRRYRAAFALTTEHDSQGARQKLFKGYDKIDGVSSDRRVGASLIVTGDLRDWFDDLASEAVTYLGHLKGSEA
jgi:hypothetical protein